MDTFFQFYLPTRIVVGSPGWLADAAVELESFQGRRAGVVTDAVIRGLASFQALGPVLAEAGIEWAATFDNVPPDSDVDVVEAVSRTFQEAGCDMLVAVGGGSVIDTAKAVNIVLTAGGDLRDYQGVQVLTAPLFPLVVIPTTVGTGSEVTSIAVVLDKQDDRKLTFVDKHLTPTLALLDPAVTFTLPVTMVAATAMDALTHAVEAFVDVEHSPFSDMYAVEASRRIRSRLLTALNPEDNQEARAELQWASTLAGVAFNHSMVGVVHALAHSLGSVARVPHGVANYLMLVEGLRCNADEVPDRIVEFAVKTGFVAAESPDVDVNTAIAAIESFRDEVGRKAGLPTNLTGAGVRPDQIPALVEKASEDGSLVYNPRYVSEEELQEMYERRMGD